MKLELQEPVETLEDAEARLKLLSKRKTQLDTTLKRSRKTTARAMAEKKQVTEEIKKTRKVKNLFTDMSEDEARKLVVDRIRSTNPEDLYPKEMEKEFDRIDKKVGTGDRSIMDVKSESDEDAGYDEADMIEGEVLDLYSGQM